MRTRIPLFSVVLITLLSSTVAQVYLRSDGTTSDTYELIKSVMGARSASEVPDCHHNQTHIWQDFDSEFNHTVFHFSAHIEEDDDACCCGFHDRQRTEIRPDYGDLTAYFGDSVSYSWDFRLSGDFQVSYLFTHVSQIKAVGGKDSMPIVTTQLLKTEDDKDLLMIIHMDGLALNSTTNATTLASIDLDEVRGQWIHAEQSATFGWDGAYGMRMTRKSDGKVLVDVNEPAIEMWRYDDGADVVNRTIPKWGIYRSKNYYWQLKDEVIKFDNFCFGKNGEFCP